MMRVERGISMAKYLRVRVSIDILELLCRGRKACIGSTSLTWVDFWYERLSIFCYWCEKLDRDDRDCSLWIQSKESLGLEDRQYGPWLEANSEQLQRPLMAKVRRKENKKEKEAMGREVWDNRH